MQNEETASKALINVFFATWDALIAYETLTLRSDLCRPPFLVYVTRVVLECGWLTMGKRQAGVYSRHRLICERALRTC